MPDFSIVSDINFKKFFRKIRMVFEEIDPQFLRFWLFVESSKEYVQNLEAALFFVDVSQAFDYIHRGKMYQILRAYGFPKKNVITINVYKANVDLSDSETDFFNIVVRVLLGDSLTPFLIQICLDYVLRTSVDQMKENRFTLKIVRSRYSTETLNEHYADDQALLVNTPAESLLNSPEQAARDIGLYMDTDKTEFMCFNQDGVISFRSIARLWN